MARWWRHLLIVAAGTAAALPLRVQLDLSHGASWPIVDAAALAKGGDGSGNNGGGGRGGDGNGGGNGNGGGEGAARAATVAAKETAAAKAARAGSVVGETQGADPVPGAATAVTPPEEVPALAAVTAMAGAKGTRVMAVVAA